MECKSLIKCNTNACECLSLGSFSYHFTSSCTFSTWYIDNFRFISRSRVLIAFRCVTSRFISSDLWSLWMGFCCPCQHTHTRLFFLSFLFLYSIGLFCFAYLFLFLIFDLFTRSDHNVCLMVVSIPFDHSRSLSFSVKDLLLENVCLYICFYWSSISKVWFDCQSQRTKILIASQ